MTILIIGLIIFLGAHSVRIVAEPGRAALIARIGPHRWKALYSLASAVGLVLIVWGYGLARVHAELLWAPPRWTRDAAALLTAAAFILIAAAYVPGNRIKAAVGHPMVAGVLIWSIAHLLANGSLTAVVLFGAFMVWAMLDFASSRRRDRTAGTRYANGTPVRDAITVIVGLGGWLLFAFVLHGWLIGVRPFG